MEWLRLGGLSRLLVDAPSYIWVISSMMDGGGDTDALDFRVPGQDEDECLLAS